MSLKVPFVAVLTLTSGMMLGQDIRSDVQQNYKKWLDCSFHWLVSTHTVCPDFTVAVAFRGKPMADVSLSLDSQPSDDGRPSKSFPGQTDSEGHMTFYSVPAGKYWLRITESASPTGVEINVVPDASDDGVDRIQIEWPNPEVTAREIKGTLHDLDEHAFKNVRIEALDFRNSQLIDSTIADSTGRYHMQSVPNGVYVLRFFPPGEIVRRPELAIEIDDGSLNREMPVMQLHNDPCGAWIIPER